MGRHAGMWMSVLAASAVCAAGARADEPVLHEFVPDVRPNEIAVALGAADAQGEAAGGSGNAIEYKGETLPSPSGQRAPEGPSLTAAPGDGLGNEAPGRRSPTFRPDRQTELEGNLDYYAAFNPSIAPFKRVTSLDAVQLAADGKTPVLGLSDARRTLVPIETPAAAPPDPRPRDRFWGDVQLDFGAGGLVPLPSVAPDSRLLSLETTPAVALRIERDVADNYYARLIGAAPAGRVRLVFLTDAPRSYFAADVPRIPLASLPKRPVAMDPGIARRALAFARTLGLDTGSDLQRALETLVAHFRAFEESSEPPADSGDVYLDLVRGKKGVCRHRAYGFVVTAQALGIRARFLQNEAHSFVEVELPGSGFLRIDLGGAAHGLTAHGAADRPVYTPSQPDSLPRPEAYQRSYSTLAHGVSGMRPSRESVAGRWVDATNASSQASAPNAAQSRGDDAASEASFLAGAGTSSATSAGDERRPLALALSARQGSVLRGQKLALGGRVTDEGGAGVAGLRIEVSLASAKRNQRMLLGVTVSDDNGYFRAAVGIPPELAVGDYHLVVLSPGNARFLPVVAE